MDLIVLYRRNDRRIIFGHFTSVERQRNRNAADVPFTSEQYQFRVIVGKARPMEPISIIGGGINAARVLSHK